MSSKKLILAYCSENAAVAKKIETDLSKVGIRFSHHHCGSNFSDLSMSKELQRTDGQIFLLISDNYLKSTDCMTNALELLDKGLKSDRLQSIIIDGVDNSNAAEGSSPIPTEFTRITDLIKYMNIWQEHYLKLRKNKETISKKKMDEYEIELKMVRDVSAEVGEFLRLLRDSSFWTMEQLTNNHYELFFNKIGKQDLLIKNKNRDKELDDQDVIIEDDKEVVVAPVTESIDEFISEGEINQVQPVVLPELQPQEHSQDLWGGIFEEDGNGDDASTEEETEAIAIADIEPDDEMTEIVASTENNGDSTSHDDDFFERMNQLINDGKSHKAKKKLKDYVSIHDQSAAAYYLLGTIAQSDQEFDESRNNFEDAAALDPYNSTYLLALGLLLFKHFPDAPEDAANAFYETIQNDPENADAHYYYAVMLTEVFGKNKKAIKHLNKTLELQPEHPFANYDLAIHYFNKKKYKKAAHFYEKAYEIDPNFRTEENDKAFKYEKYITKKQMDIIAEPSDAVSEEPIMEEEDISPDQAIAPEVEAPAKKELTDTVMITGATSGIGKATAKLFASKGYRLILTGRRADRLADLKNEFEENFNTEVTTLAFDIRYKSATRDSFKSLPEEWKQIDLLINNAGLAKGYAPIHEGDLKDWDIMIDTNVKGLLYITRLVSPHMVKRQSGHIINICSSAGHEVYPNGNVYCATKHAVDAITKGMRLELHKHNIRVSQVSPGHVEETEFAVVRFDGDKERANIYEDFQPLKSSDVAETIYYIAKQPPHVTIQEVIMMGTQQASSNFIDRSGRKDEES